MVTYLPVNATGWNELFSGHLVTAAFTMYDTAFMGWTIAVLFIVYQFMLYLKTRNATISWITGLIFVSLYITSTIMKAQSARIIFLILVLELAGILYTVIWKN